MVGHDALFEAIDVLRGRPREVSRLEGGLTNENLKVTTPEGAYVVRRWTSDAALLGIDRDAEHLNSIAAAEAGVGAPVVDYRPDLGAMVVRFLEGSTWDNQSFDRAGSPTRAGRAIRQLHEGPRFVGDFDMFARRRRYLRLIRDNGYWLPDGYSDHEDRLEQVRRALGTTATVPCNNDLLAANFIDDGEKLWLIDYEYSGNNDACFELGNTATECGFSSEQADAYVEAYFGIPTRADLARVRLQALCSEYGWSLWGFIQAAASPIDYDFEGWGMERYEKAVATFRGPDLPRLLTLVAS